jgi:hypothetical protein
MVQLIRIGGETWDYLISSKENEQGIDEPGIWK